MGADRERRGRGARTALLAGVAAIAAIALAAWTARDHLLAPWYRRVLLSGSREESFRAAEKLAAIRDFEAIPLIIRANAEKNPNSEYDPHVEALRRLIEADPRRAAGRAAPCLVSPHHGTRLVAAYILDAYCPARTADEHPFRPAVPQLIAALRDPDSNVRGFCMRILKTIGPDAQEAVGPLRRILRTPAYVPDECALARDALDAIEGRPTPATGRPVF
jgi:hypothetical protein